MAQTAFTPASSSGASSVVEVAIQEELKPIVSRAAVRTVGDTLIFGSTWQKSTTVP